MILAKIKITTMVESPCESDTDSTVCMFVAGYYLNVYLVCLNLINVTSKWFPNPWNHYYNRRHVIRIVLHVYSFEFLIFCLYSILFLMWVCAESCIRIQFWGDWLSLMEKRSGTQRWLLDLFCKVCTNFRYLIWWQLAYEYHCMISNCEIMVKILCHARLLRTDDVRLKKASYVSTILHFVWFWIIGRCFLYRNALPKVTRWIFFSKIDNISNGIDNRL